MMTWNPSMERCSYLLFLLAWLIPSSPRYTASGINIQCVGKEREALLNFRQGIEADKCGLLTSWEGQECCHWYGIHCSNHSGHVIGLDLRGTTNQEVDCSLEGNLSPSLVELKHLKYLDLSWNHFQNQPIPYFVASLVNLEYLNLSCTGFQGEIPHRLANLSSLTSLDLSGCSSSLLYAKSLRWLSHLTSLRDINLGLVNLSLATDWVQVVNNLPFLRTLQMEQCSLSQSIPSLSLSYTNTSTTLHVLDLHLNTLTDSSVLQWASNLTRISTSLEYLDLSENWIQGPIPSAFGNYMHSLLHLDLHDNRLQGPIPIAFGNMDSLSYLDLSSNALEGLVPGSIFELKLLGHLSLSENNFQGIQFSHSQGSLCSLQTLDLSNNNINSEFSSIIQTLSGCANNSLVILELSNNSFWGSITNTIAEFLSLQELHLDSNELNGTVSPSLGQLSGIEWLDLSSNSLGGTLSEHHLSNLSRLSHLDLHDNPELMINISANWIPPFQLFSISLRSCKNPAFPEWLLTQGNLYDIDISSAGISDTIPSSFWNPLWSNLQHLNLSNNKIHGPLPNLPPKTMPNQAIIAYTGLTIDLSSNLIEGAIPWWFLGNSTILFLNDNRLSGSMASFCPKSEAYTEILDLSNNLFSGELPDCWNGFMSLGCLHLDNNNLTGKLPPSFGALNQLQYLSMRNNSFNGELQEQVQNWTRLLVLDLGYNSFTGHIPAAIGSIFSAVQILNLRGNKIFGKLPVSLCRLSNLQIMDLSYNQISGTIPKCIGHLAGMKNSIPDPYAAGIQYHVGYKGSIAYEISEMLMWKRNEQIFARTLGLVKYIAVSDNQLQGQIPSEISGLTGLISLDLARNNLTGSIPPKIGQLKSLEVLDLSGNCLSGEIPLNLADLNFLDILNLSYNKLSGKIPASTQLQSLDPSAYVGNPGLCGPPLSACTRDPALSMPKEDNIPQEENHGNDMFPELYISVALGFIIGFWGVCGTLVIKRSWRHTYFRFIEDMYDRLHVMVAVTAARVWRRP